MRLAGVNYRQGSGAFVFMFASMAPSHPVPPTSSISLRLLISAVSANPFVELIVAARAWSADLIVVGGSCRTEESFLASTSERIPRKALVPVIVAKKPLIFQAKTFLVPTDFSACAKKAAEAALVLAKNFSIRVIFFHALDSAPSYMNWAYPCRLRRRRPKRLNPSGRLSFPVCR
jgi:nucleotide-binding universal stress UspA family protein